MGQSTGCFHPENRFRIEDYVADLAAIVADLGSPIHYCGESFGGLLGLELTARRPELVRSLTLVATPMRISPEAQKMMSLGYPTWQDALRTLGAKGWSEAMNGELRFPPDADRAMIEAFLVSVRAGVIEYPCATGEDGVRALEVALAGYRSSALGQVVELR